jgi:hypothetical protein
MSTQSFIEQLDAARALASDIKALEEQVVVKKRLLEEIVVGGVIPSVAARNIIRSTQHPVQQLPENMMHAPLIERVVKALEINEGIPMTARELSELVGDDRVQSIHSMLVRKADRGVIQRAGEKGDGRYVWLRKQAEL